MPDTLKPGDRVARRMGLTAASAADLGTIVETGPNDMPPSPDHVRVQWTATRAAWQLPGNLRLVVDPATHDALGRRRDAQAALDSIATIPTGRAVSDADWAQLVTTDQVAEDDETATGRAS